MSPMLYVRRLPALALSTLVKAYRIGLSPLLPPRCRYAPTCSEYALEAIQQHGALMGLRLSFGRILRCHPWGGSGYDPVPSVQLQCKHDRVRQTQNNGRKNAPTLEA